MQNYSTKGAEELLSDAVGLHNKGQHEDALELRSKAYLLAPIGSFVQGRAARDQGASYDHLGDTFHAEVWNEQAYFIHDSILSTMGDYPTREALREHSASAGNMMITGLRKVIKAKQEGIPIDVQSVLDYKDENVASIEKAKAKADNFFDRHLDQYEINFNWRVSVVESLLGKREVGFDKAILSIAKLAIMSESPRLNTSDVYKNYRQIGRSKGRAFLGGLAALGVNILASPKDNLRQRAALKLASIAI
jgi:hypothetical protein